MIQKLLISSQNYTFWNLEKTIKTNILGGGYFNLKLMAPNSKINKISARSSKLTCENDPHPICSFPGTRTNKFPTPKRKNTKFARINSQLFRRY